MSEVVKYTYIDKNNYAIFNNLHQHQSYNDEPSCIHHGYYSYHCDGEWHRKDAPARIYSDDIMKWYNYGIEYEPKCQKL